MKKYLFLIFVLIASLSACSNSNHNSHDDETPQLLEVSIETPDQIKANEEVSLEAHVSQGAEKVEDAEEVKFEIWKSESDDHETIMAKHQADGVYTVKKSFPEDGTYFVVAHVTARNMHNMPKKEIQVGDAEMAVQHNEDMDDDHGSDEDHEGMLSYDFHGHQSFKANEESMLSVKITSEDKPLTGASVKFEYWKENTHQHEFIEAMEKADGEYMTSTTFTEPGNYTVKIHVEKDDIHDHTEQNIEVK